MRRRWSEAGINRPPQWFDSVRPSTLIDALSIVLLGTGACAATLAVIDDPIVGRRALVRFAIAHFVFGALWLAPWSQMLGGPAFRSFGWAPLIAGAALLYAGLTARTATPLRRILSGGLFDDRQHGDPYALRSRYEQHIRQSARQEERARLARDLHDAIKQQLFVVQTAAATAETRLGSDVAGAREALAAVRTAAREALVEMRAMIEQLQAVPLENVGLAEALKKQGEALGFRTGAEVRVEIGELPPSEALPPGAQQALFRAAQEALANIGRHARPKHVRITLGKAKDRLELSITDDGLGFDPVKAQRGMGIDNMIARAREIGGSLEVRSKPGEGTTIEFGVPSMRESPWYYGGRAIAWTAFLVIIVFTWAHAGFVPMSSAVAAITGLMALRNVIAFTRVIRRKAAA